MTRVTTPKEVAAEELTAVLVKHVMGWNVGPDRFLLADRNWMPRWKFQPTKNLEDAFRLLDAAKPLEYVLRFTHEGAYRVQVRTILRSAEANGSSLAFVICVAIARVYGIGEARIE